jgi:hypothetical protein
MHRCGALFARSSKPPTQESLLTIAAAASSSSSSIAPPLASSPRRFTPPPPNTRHHPYAVSTARQQSAEAAAAAAQRANTQRLVTQGFHLWYKKAKSFLTLTLGDAKYESPEVQEELKRTQNISVSKAMGFGFGSWSEYRNIPTIDRPDKKDPSHTKR